MNLNVLSCCFFQLSGEPNSSASHDFIQQLQNEKTELENKLEQVKQTNKKK